MVSSVPPVVEGRTSNDTPAVGAGGRWDAALAGVRKYRRAALGAALALCTTAAVFVMATDRTAPRAPVAHAAASTLITATPLSPARWAALERAALVSGSRPTAPVKVAPEDHLFGVRK